MPFNSKLPIFRWQLPKMFCGLHRFWGRAFLEVTLRQHRTKTIYWILHVSCLHIFRHIAQFVLARRQPCVFLIVQSDEKSDCAIHAQSLCGIALRKYYHSERFQIFLNVDILNAVFRKVFTTVNHISARYPAEAEFC